MSPTLRIRIFILFGLMVCALHLSDSRRAFAVIVASSVADQLVVPGERMFELNLDGVVQLQSHGQTHCTASVISDRHLLTAAHCFDEDQDQQLDLFETGTYQARIELAGRELIYQFSLQDIQLPANWVANWADLAVIELGEAIDAEVPRYTLNADPNELGQEIVLIGYGAMGRGTTGGGVIVNRRIAGKNRYEMLGEDLTEISAPAGAGLVYDFDSGQLEENAIVLRGFASDLGFGVLEAIIDAGDSGGPTFLGGSIAGVVNMKEQGGIGDTRRAVGTFGEIGFDTRVSSFRVFIETATGGAARFAGAAGDFDLSGTLDTLDIDLLTRAILNESNDVLFDLNTSRSVDLADQTVWVQDLVQTHRGDANLDGNFDSHDLIAVFVAGEFEDTLVTNSGWATGDWNGDREFTSQDLVRAFEDGGYQVAPRRGTPRTDDGRFAGYCRHVGPRHQTAVRAAPHN